MRFARENGAVALTFRPFEGDRVLTDPHFYPIFEEAERLDMAMALHIANGSRPHAAFLTSAIAERRAWAFSMFRVPTVNASLILMLSEVPALFPKLRWAFIEAAAQWMPWIFNETARRLILTGQPAPADLFEQNNIYVTCQTDDDLPWVLKYAGENSLMIGTDYGHKDPSSDIDATMGIRDYEGIGDATKDNILYHNPKRLYGLKLDT
jgi:predicted TIM-barrel fold metal-dependent hydrolase